MWANWSRCSGQGIRVGARSRAGPTAPSSSGSGRRSPAASRPGSGAGGAGRPRASAPVFPPRRPRPPVPPQRRRVRRRVTSPACSAPPRPVSPASRSAPSSRRAAARACPGRPGRTASRRSRPRRVDRAGDDLAPALDPRPRRRPRCGPRLRSRRAERLDLAALVRLARRADAVRPLGLMASRADIDARRLDAVLRAALVATGLRCFLLGDCHSGRPYSERSIDLVGATASRKRRSWETTTRVPSYACRAGSSCSIASRSRWLVGSSSTSRFTSSASAPPAAHGCARPVTASRLAARRIGPRSNFASSVLASTAESPVRAVNADISASPPS